MVRRQKRRGEKWAVFMVFVLGLAAVKKKKQAMPKVSGYHGEL